MQTASTLPEASSSQPAAVARIRRFYDEWSEAFLTGCDSTFQSGLALPNEYSDEDPDASAVFLARRAGIGPSDRVLDAGCGVGGPAIAIAKAFPGVEIDGVTISEVQARLGRSLIEEAGLAERVRIHLGDFHRLLFPDASFDQAIFLEVTGYSYDLPALYQETARVLRPGGRVYVKDVFRRAGPLTDQQRHDLEVFDEMWACVGSPSVANTTAALTAAGFVDISVDQYPHVGTNRFVGAMFQLNSQDGLRLSRLGEAFFRTFADLPVLFAEVKARRRNGAGPAHHRDGSFGPATE